MFKYFLPFFVLFFYSCDNNTTKIIETIEDPFNENTAIWERDEVTDSTRYKIVQDPLDSKNNCILFSLFPDDLNAGGKRNEFTLKTKDTIGYTVEYSFKFMFPDSFFKKRKKTDWVMFHQWHDDLQ